jgi:hypothetical protein
LFIDFEKAFDRVPRDLLFRKLQRYGVIGQYAECLQHLYNNTTVLIAGDTDDDVLLELFMGVLQGDPLSPLLFMLYTADLVHHLRSTGLSENELLIILFADDLTMMFETMDGLERGVDLLVKWCNAWGLKINWKKTKLMRVNDKSAGCKEHALDCQQPTCIVQISDQVVEVTRTFKLLGILLDYKADMKRFGNALISSVQFHCMNWKDWWNGCNDIVSVKVGLWAFEAVVRSRSEYGIEFLSENHIAIVAVGELVHETLKVLLGVPWSKVVKISVAYELGQQEYHERHKMRKMGTLIHLLSFDNVSRAIAAQWMQQTSGAEAFKDLAMFSELAVLNNGAQSIILPEDASRTANDAKTRMRTHYRDRTFATIQGHVIAANAGKHVGTKLRTYAIVAPARTSHKPHPALSTRSV